METAFVVDDLKRKARRRVPKMFFDYVDSGSWTESTYRSNAEAWTSIRLRQRVLVNIDNRQLSTTMLGETVTMPVALAPTGMCGLQYPDGEIRAAQAAEAFGVPFTLSTMSICSIEAVAAATRRPFWFQLYVMRDRAFVRDLIARAKVAGCSALVLTADLQMSGQRQKDMRNNLAGPPRFTLQHISQLAARPGWCLRMLGTKNRTFGNVIGHARGVTEIGNLFHWVGQQFDPELDWSDVEWIRREWGGKLIIKGIMDKEDARLAAATGADALVVSNHGGRQLDGAPSSAEMLPGIVDAVGDRIEVFVDGGITSGQDVLKALCLGAKGTFIGRAFLYGLAAGGRPGVERTLEILRTELDMTLGLCGERDVAALSRDNLHREKPA